MAAIPTDDAQRRPLVPETRPEALPQADVLVGPEEVTITVAIAGAEPDGVDARIDTRSLVLTNRPGLPTIHYRVTLPVVVRGDRPHISVVNGVVDVTVRRAYPRATARTPGL